MITRQVPDAGRVEAFGPEHAEVYELTYRGRGKDWAEEARSVAEIVRSHRSLASSLLDVGCGTGAHLEVFDTLFADVEGLEIAPAMRARAQRRLPHRTVHAGDMRCFELGRRFEAVVCLFTVIAYAGTVSQMRAAIACMSRHLVAGGVLVVEPWWFPEKFLDNYVGGDLVRTQGQTIARVSHSTRRGRATHLRVRWVVGDATGIRDFTATEVMSLFTLDEYVQAFRDAGCAVEYQEGWLTGRGLFVATRRG